MCRILEIRIDSIPYMNMKMHTRIILISIIVIEFLCIVIVGIIIYFKKYDRFTKNVFHVLPIQKVFMRFPSDTNLRYYYELQPNSQKEDDFSYMRLSGSVIHTINADGLNEEKEYVLTAPPRTFRITTLGDSFTEGAFVETSKNYSEVLEDMLNTQLRCKNIDHYEVINLGVAGYDVQYNLERFKRKGMKYNPDLVILWTDENDYIFNNEKYYELSSKWNPTIEAPDIVSMYRSEGDFAPEANAIWYKFNSLYARNDLIAGELSYLRELFSIYAGPILIFSLNTIPVDIRQSIQLLVNNRDNTYFFPEIPQSYDKFPDNHPTPLGHEQFAQVLFKNIVDHGIIPCET